MDSIKHIAIVGGNKEGLSLLPLLEKDPGVRVELIVESNPDALIYKLNELGFRMARKFNIRTSSDLNDLLAGEGYDLIIDASSDPHIRTFLEQEAFQSTEIISELSARLLWAYREEKLPGSGKKSSSKLLASLNEIVQAVNLTKDKKQVSALILKVAIEATDADNGSLMLLDPADNILKVEVAEGIPEEIIPTIRCPIGEGIAGKVARDGKPLLLSGRADDRNFRILRKREDVKSALCVPLMINGSTVGVLNLNNLRTIDGFTEEDLAFITKLAAFDTEILIKSQEYELLRGDARTFRIWKELNSILNSPPPLEERLIQLCRTLSRHFRESVCSIYLLDRSTRELTLTASSLKEFRPSERLKVHLKEGIDGWAASEQEVVILREFPSLDPHAQKAFMSIPLVSEGEVTGVMNIQLISTRGLTEDEETLLRDIGRHLSTAIHSARKEDSAYLRATRMEAVHEAGVNLLSITDLDKLLELIPPSASMIMDADGCILRLSEKDGMMKIRSTYSMWEDEILEKVFELDGEISARVQQTLAPVHIRELGKETGTERFGKVVKSLIALPLLEEGKLQGILTIYDKIPKGSFHATSFGDDDLEILKKYGYFVQKAITHATGSIPSGILLRYDPLTGLPNEAAFQKELENEINRSRRYNRRFILLTFLWNPRKSGMEKYDVEMRNNLVLEICKVLQENIREYDSMARTGPRKIEILFPESYEKIRDLCTRLTRAIRAQKKTPGSILSEMELELKFGYAVFPEDGTDFRDILHQAGRLRLGATI